MVSKTIFNDHITTIIIIIIKVELLLGMDWKVIQILVLKNMLI